MADKIYKAYIIEKLDPILHPMATQTFLAQPDDHIKFMMDYLKEHHGNRMGINTNERMELEFLRKEVPALKSQLRPQNAKDRDSNDTDSSDDSDENEEHVADLVAMATSSEARGKRASVSAEVFGNWNKQEGFKPPKYEKSTEVMAALKSRLDQAFIFNTLNPDEMQIIMLAFRSVICKAGDVVITEGEAGEDLYCV